jgi:hypothetical protein
LGKAGGLLNRKEKGKEEEVGDESESEEGVGEVGEEEVEIRAGEEGRGEEEERGGSNTMCVQGTFTTCRGGGFPREIEKEIGVLEVAGILKKGDKVDRGRSKHRSEEREKERRQGKQNREGGGPKLCSEGGIQKYNDECIGRSEEKAKSITPNSSSGEGRKMCLQTEEDVCGRERIERSNCEEQGETRRFKSTSSSSGGGDVASEDRSKGLLLALQVSREGENILGSKMGEEVLCIQSSSVWVHNLSRSSFEGQQRDTENSETEGIRGDSMDRRFLVCFQDGRGGKRRSRSNSEVHRRVGFQVERKVGSGAKAEDGVSWDVDRYDRNEVLHTNTEEGKVGEEDRGDFKEGREGETISKGFGKVCRRFDFSCNGIEMDKHHETNSTSNFNEEAQKVMGEEGVLGERSSGKANLDQGKSEGERGEEFRKPARKKQVGVDRCIRKVGMGDSICEGRSDEKNRSKLVIRRRKEAHQLEGIESSRNTFRRRSVGMVGSRRGGDLEIIDRQYCGIGICEERGRKSNRTGKDGGRDCVEVGKEEDRGEGIGICQIGMELGGSRFKEGGQGELGSEGLVRRNDIEVVPNWNGRLRERQLAHSTKLLLKVGVEEWRKKKRICQEMGGNSLGGTTNRGRRSSSVGNVATKDSCISVHSKLGQGVDQQSEESVKMVYRNNGDEEEHIDIRTKSSGGRNRASIIEATQVAPSFHLSKYSRGEERRDPLEKITREQYNGHIRRFEEWCREVDEIPFPTSSRLLERYIWHMVLQKKWGGGVKDIGAALRRRAKEEGEQIPNIPNDAIVVGRKLGKKRKEVRPFVWKWAMRWLEGRGEGMWRRVTLIGLALRLMLRPGEPGRIKSEHIRRGREGVLVQLVGRKSDKIWRRDPWHFVECDHADFCIACGMWKLALEVKDSESKLLFQGKDGGMKSEEFATVLNVVARELKIGEGRFFTGKSCRVGGAIAAALAGVEESEIRIIGSWSSDALYRYIGGIMAMKSKMMEAVKSADEDSIWFSYENIS